MLTVKEYLIAAGLDIDADRIKLVKHVDQPSRGLFMREIIKTGAFDFYQSEQGKLKKPFHGCDVIISFISLGNKLAEFWGVYNVKGFRNFTKEDKDNMPEVMSHLRAIPKHLIWYDLEELETFSCLKKRIIIQWNSTRGWYQKKDLDIYEMLPPIEVIPFPGYQDVILNLQELRQIISNPRAHKDWKAALEANAGIYRIVDMSSGEIYIGSAYGHEGIWGRWSIYAKNGHGGNKLLKGRDSNKFQWSIVRTVSRSMSERDVIKAEAMEKLKHGSQVHGLNDN